MREKHEQKSEYERSDDFAPGAFNISNSALDTRSYIIFRLKVRSTFPECVETHAIQNGAISRSEAIGGVVMMSIMALSSAVIVFSSLRYKVV